MLVQWKQFWWVSCWKLQRTNQFWNPLNTMHVIYGHTCSQINVFQIGQHAGSFDTSHRLSKIDCLTGVFNEIIMRALRYDLPNGNRWIYPPVVLGFVSSWKLFPHVKHVVFAGMSGVAQIKEHLQVTALPSTSISTPLSFSCFRALQIGA